MLQMVMDNLMRNNSTQWKLYNVTLHSPSLFEVNLRGCIYSFSWREFIGFLVDIMGKGVGVSPFLISSPPFFFGIEAPLIDMIGGYINSQSFPTMPYKKKEHQEKEATKHLKMDIKNTPTQSSGTTSSALYQISPTSIMLGTTPLKTNIPKEVADLGDYYFSKVFQVVLRKTPKKRKVDEMGQEIVVIEEPEMVWQVSNQPKKNIAKDTAQVMWDFGDANRTTV